VRLSFVYSLRETHAVNKTILANMSKDFDTEEDLHFFAQPYLFEFEYTTEPEDNTMLNKVVVFAMFGPKSIFDASKNSN